MVNCVSCGKRLFWADSRNAKRMNGECRACTAESQQEDNLDVIKIDLDDLEDELAEPEYLSQRKLLAQNGDIMAQYNLGWQYRNGEGVQTNYEEAIKWWSMSADQGDEPSINALGHLYRHGHSDMLINGKHVSILKDYSKAIEWYMLGAVLGYSHSQNILGEMYNVGEGLLQDNIMAHMWFNIASANGDEDGRKNRDAVAKNMTPEDISKATAMARECMNSDYKKCGH
jgi:uncharacterized protein